MPEFGWVREGRVPVVCPGSTRQREELIMAELTGKAAAAAALKAMVEDRKTLVDARGEAVDTRRRGRRRGRSSTTGRSRRGRDSAHRLRRRPRRRVDHKPAQQRRTQGPQGTAAPRRRRTELVEDPPVGTGVADELAPATGY